MIYSIIVVKTHKVPFLPEKLKEENYSTHYVGKWHGGFCNEKLLPTNRGI